MVSLAIGHSYSVSVCSFHFSPNSTLDTLLCVLSEFFQETMMAREQSRGQLD